MSIRESCPLVTMLPSVKGIWRPLKLADRVRKPRARGAESSRAHSRKEGLTQPRGVFRFQNRSSDSFAKNAVWIGIVLRFRSRNVLRVSETAQRVGLLKQQLEDTGGF